MLRPNNKVSQCDAVPFSSTHYSNYYVQEEADDGVVMESSVPVKDVIFFHISIHLKEKKIFFLKFYVKKKNVFNQSLSNNGVFSTYGMRD